MTASDVQAPRRLPVAPARAVVDEVWLLTRGRRGALALAGLLLLGAAGLGLVFPLVVGWIVDTVSTRDGSDVPSEFWQQLGLLAGAVILSGVLEFAGMVRLTHVAETIIAGLRERYVEKALDLPPDVVESVGVGDVVSRSSSDIREVSDIVPWVLPTLAAALFTLVLSFAAMAAVDWRFAVGLLAALPLYALAFRWYVGAAPEVYAAQRSAESERSHQVLTTIQALPTVRAFAMGPSRRHAVRVATWQLVRWAMRTKIVQNKLFGRTNTAEAVGLLLMLGTGFAMAASGRAGVGEVTAATLLYFRIVAPVETLLIVMDDVQAAAASLGRIVGVSAAPPADRGTAEQGPTGEPARTAVLAARDVEFAYRPGHRVVDGITLAVGAGEHVAVVGESGSGKTTLARLLAGNGEPSAGSIERSVDLTDIAYLTQEHHVFAGTVADNLSLGRPSASPEELEDAWNLVTGVPLTEHFGDGLGTQLGEHALRVGAAVAQQLALARLVLSDASVVILDEATAEADSRDSAMLEAATRRVLAGRTAIVIAHRLDQATACDRIVVLDAGRIVEQGTHDELTALDGRYATLWDAWSAARR